MKKLLDTPGEDKMANKEVEHCNLFGHVNEERGTYLTTRGNTYTEKTKDSSSSKGKKKRISTQKELGTDASEYNR